MTMTPFTCNDFSEQLADYLERDASSDVTAAMELHAATCGACAVLLQEIAAITSEAAALPELTPARDLWSGIAARIDAPVIPIATASSRRDAGTGAARWRRWWAHPGLAAAALVGITAGVTYYLTRESLERPVAPPAAAQAPVVDGEGSMVDAVQPTQLASGEGLDEASRGASGVAAPGAAGSPTGMQRLAASGQRAGSSGSGIATSPAGDLQLASYRPGETAALDSLYYREIIRLRGLLNERRTQLDSSTVSVINRNMLVIDRAIQECRAALAADPASKFLNQQLNQALETKIELLRTAATMPAVSQGD